MRWLVACAAGSGKPRQNLERSARGHQSSPAPVSRSRSARGRQRAPPPRNPRYGHRARGESPGDVCAPESSTSSRCGRRVRPSNALFTLQYCRDRTRQVMPLLFVLCGCATAVGGQRVILALAAVFGSAPLGLDLTLPFELMQGRVERAFLELEGIGTAPRDFLQQLIAVHLFSGQQIEQQQADAALQELAVDIHCIHYLAYQALYSKV